MELGFAQDASAWARRLARTPFAAALSKGAALIAACGDPPRVAFATPAALAVFGAGDVNSLSAFLFAGDSPGARRLARLTVDMPAGAPPRLERLRLFVARRALNLSWLCARIVRDGETWFVATDAAAAEAPRETPSPPVAAAPVAETPTRFVWRLDEAGRFGAPDPALVGTFGVHAPEPGETLEAFAGRLGLGPEWPRRIAARETFSGLEVLWPGPDGRAGETVKLSGAPILNGRDYAGFRGFGLMSGVRQIPSPDAVAQTPAPETAPAETPPAITPPGDAAALLTLLQRQHSAPTPQPAAAAPALAIINALAALLQPKPPAKAPPPRAPGGAEIVVLRPHAPPEPPRERADEGSVALSSKERDAFKEIARALGVNVRPARPGIDDAPAEPPPAPEPPPPSDEDLAGLVGLLPIAALVVREGEALYASRALLELSGHADLADFRARKGLDALFRGRNPAALIGDETANIPVVGAGGALLTVQAAIEPVLWNGAEADLVTLRPSRAVEHQAEMRALEREAAVHAARARDYAAALEAARDGMARLDRQGRLLALNSGAERLLGCDQREAAGESFLTLFLPLHHAEATAALERAASGEAQGLQGFEAVARSRDGRLEPVRAEIGRFASAPEPEFFLLFSQAARAASGVDEARAAREEADKANAAKTELLSRVSHELRTPLHAILGFAEVILEERFGPLGAERYRAYLHDILSSGRHLLSLVDDLTDLTRIELGKIDLTFEPLDVNGIVRECVALMQPQASRERVIMRMSLSDKPSKVMADARSLKQIMINLMANAVKYNEPGGQVIVSTACDEAGGVVIRVRDTGVGMSESELAVALQPFRRVPGGRATEGTGLGLPLTKALAEANHAGFTIKSRKNQGTLVEIAFPVRHAAQ